LLGFCIGDGLDCGEDLFGIFCKVFGVEGLWFGVLGFGGFDDFVQVDLPLF
jgi:hypothetical protein